MTGIAGLRSARQETDMKIMEQYVPAAIPAERQMEKISVIVTVYNIERYLERAVDSILSQTYRKLEIILVDDGSTDTSGALCDGYAKKDKRVIVIHQENGGAYSARNAGLAAASGELVTFVDGDDWIDPGMYETLVSAMREKDADLAVCRYRKVFDGNTDDRSTPLAAVFDGQELLAKYLEEDEKWLIQTAVWNKLWRRKLSEGLAFPRSIYEDMYFTIRLLARSEKSIYLDTALYNYYCSRAESTTNIGLSQKTFDDLIPNFYDRSAFLRKLGREDLALLQDYYLYKRLLLFYTAVRCGRDPHKKEWEAFLTEKLKAGEPSYPAVYSIPQANPKEYQKMKLFLKSPALYVLAMRLNDSVAVPLKQRFRKR